MPIDLAALRARLTAALAWVGRAIDWPNNRNAVLAAAVALVGGLWGGAVLAAPQGVSAGGGLLAIAASGPEARRSANAARGLPRSVEGMGMTNIRLDLSGAAPRACLEFSRALATAASIDYHDFIQLEPAAPFDIDRSGTLLCLGGLPFEPDRQLTVLEGLPAQDGSKTPRSETFTLSFGDRPAYVGFAGNGVILPRAEADGLGIETVNVSKLEIEVLRVPDRILSQRDISEGEAMEEGSWGWFGEGGDVGVPIYKGNIDIALNACPQAPQDRACTRRNQAVTSVFALGAELKDLRPGAYIVRAKDVSPGAGANGRNTDRPAFAYRWIVYTDTALQTFEGASGIDVVARSLRTARPLANVTVTLIAENNEELARARTDAEGLVHFQRALMTGEGPARARYLMAYGAGGGDFAALDLNRSALDLSDRNVDGRRTPGDIDAYLYTERGIYRPGERVRLIGLIRDNAARALSDRPSTLVVYRPNGTEAVRRRLNAAAEAGGVSQNIDLDRAAPRGSWRAELLVDGQDAAAGDVSFSVEDFVPQRLRVKMTANETPILPGQNRPVTVQADFLYGAPGSGLAVEAEGRLFIDANPFPDAAGYAFGMADESFSEQYFALPGTTTDGAGAAQLLIAFPDVATTSLPLRARIVARVADPGGRVVSDSFTMPVRTQALYLGVKAAFDGGRVRSGRAALFDVIARNAAGAASAAQNVSYQIVQEDWRYDWYLDNGSWRWRRTGRDIPVDAGAINVAANTPARLTRAGLRDGDYRLILEHASGARTMQRFSVGWTWDGGESAAPDQVTLDPPADPARPGARARIRVRAPYPGEAQIVVATDRVLLTRTVHVGESGADVDLPVTSEWGAGAYVLVTVMTPRDPVNLPIPRRAVGATYVPVNMGSRTLELTVGDGLGVVRPRTTLNVPIRVQGAPGGERVRVVIAAVDQGILALTNYQSPDPVDYFFARRGLGVSVRDDYGRLLNPNLGAPSVARQGGDSLGGEGLTVVPTKTVSLFSNIVTLDGSGRATIPLAIPDFNGELRLMGVAWSQTALGKADKALTVRDPVVAELILPRFLAPGDEAIAALNLDNVEGPAGAYSVAVSGSATAQINAQPFSATLNRGQRRTFQVPVRGGQAGVGAIALQLTGPQGFAAISRSYDIQSRAPYLPVTVVETAPQPAMAEWRAPANALARFTPGDRTALVSYSSLANLDPATLIDALDRYPYGCSEQLSSVAMPLLYYNTLAREAGRSGDARVRQRVQDAVTDAAA